jgi:ATP-dependent Zn protease
MGLDDRPEDEMLLARHEAGHAVVARHHKIRVESTTIETTEQGHGHTKPDEDQIMDRAQMIDVSLAARESVALVYDEETADRGTGTDTAYAEKLALSLHNGDKAAAWDYIEMQRDALRHLLRTDTTLRAELDAVADALIENRTLDSEQLDVARAEGRAAASG